MDEPTLRQDQTEEVTEIRIEDIKEVIPAENAAPAEPKPALSAEEIRKKNIREWVKDICLALLVAVVFLQLFMPTLVREHSMENTLQENDYVFVSRKYYTWFKHEVRRGDIIVFDSDLTTGLGFKKMLVKRIVAIPGDTISISEGRVYVNGEEQDQSFTKDGYTKSDLAQVTVPEGCIFVMGDNRQNSTDSRSPSVGFVQINSIRGKVVFRLFPISSAGGL